MIHSLYTKAPVLTKTTPAISEAESFIKKIDTLQTECLESHYIVSTLLYPMEAFWFNAMLLFPYVIIF